MVDLVEIQIQELVPASSLRNEVVSITENQETSDDWLPVTESRTGSAFSAAFLLICSGMGVQSFALPVALVSLGWYWGIISLTIGYVWQLYTIWLLVNLHESVPPGLIRYSRFMNLAVTAFGTKLGKILSLFPVLYLAGGTCTFLIINGGSCLRSLYLEMCGEHCTTRPLTGAEWYLIFIFLAILVSQFIPNLNSATKVAVIGTLAAVAYTTMLVVLSLVQIQPNGISYGVNHAPKTQKEVYGAINALGLIAFAFRGHNLILEIQGTISTSQKQSSKGSMNIGVLIAYLVIAVCFYPLTIVGYWSYGNKLLTKDNMPLLRSFMFYHRGNVPEVVRAIIYILVVIHFICLLQIYGMLAFDNLERIYIATKHKRCSKWLRGGLRVLYGGFSYFLAVTLPFLGAISALIGGITTVPLTFVYPCLMWIIVRNPRRTSPMWCLNVGIAVLGVVFLVLVEIAAIRTLIVFGLNANPYHPS